MIIQGQLVEKLEGQLQQQDGTIQELRNRIDILSQLVHDQLPVQFISPISMDPGQFLGQPGEQDLGQLLHTQPSDPH